MFLSTPGDGGLPQGEQLRGWGRPQGACNPARECRHPEGCHKAAPAGRLESNPSSALGLCGLRKGCPVSERQVSHLQEVDRTELTRQGGQEEAAKPTSGKDGFPVPLGSPPTPSPLTPDPGQAQLPLAGRPMGGGVTGSWEEWVQVTKGLLPPLRSEGVEQGAQPHLRGGSGMAPSSVPLWKVLTQRPPHWAGLLPKEDFLPSWIKKT